MERNTFERAIKTTDWVKIYTQFNQMNYMTNYEDNLCIIYARKTGFWF